MSSSDSFSSFTKSGPRRRLINISENQEHQNFYIPDAPKHPKKKKNKANIKETKEDNESSLYRDRAKERRMTESENANMPEIIGLDIDLYYNRKKAIEEEMKSQKVGRENIVKESLPVDSMEIDEETDIEKSVDSEQYFKTRVGRNVHYLLFAQKEEEILDTYIPERTYYLFNIDNNNKTQPIIIERSKDEVPSKYIFDKEIPNQEIIKMIAETLRKHSSGEKSKKRKNMDEESDEESERSKMAKTEEAVDDIDMFSELDE